MPDEVSSSNAAKTVSVRVMGPAGSARTEYCGWLQLRTPFWHNHFAGPPSANGGSGSSRQEREINGETEDLAVS